MTTIAERLIQARKSGVPCDPVHDALPDQQAAYGIQEELHAARLKSGARCIGYKVGLLSEAAMQRFAVTEPIYGRLYDSMEVMSGHMLEWSQTIQPLLEGEIAFIMGADLAHPDATASDVISAVDYILPAIEIAGPAVTFAEVLGLDMIADNGAGSYFVLGHTPKKLSEMDIVSCEMVMEINGEERTRGIGQANYGSPVNVLTWLARRLAKAGHPLRAGDIVMSGAFGGIIPAESGDDVVVAFSGLGEARIRFS